MSEEFILELAELVENNWWRNAMYNIYEKDVSGKWYLFYQADTAAEAWKYLVLGSADGSVLKVIKE